MTKRKSLKHFLKTYIYTVLVIVTNLALFLSLYLSSKGEITCIMKEKPFRFLALSFGLIYSAILVLYGLGHIAY